MRTSARRPAVLAAAAVAALSLSLTACNGADKAASGSASSPSSASEQSASGTDKSTGPGSDGKSSDTDKGKGSAGSGNDSGSGKSGSSASQTGSKKPSTGKTRACTVDDVKMSATTNPEPPFTHLELTAKNTSGRTCQLVDYPQVTFGDFHTAKVIPAVAKSKPEAPVVLEPGAPAYAKIKINYGGVDEDSVALKEFNVQVFAAGGGAQEGAEIVSVPRGFQVDKKTAKTGYWTHEFRNGADDF
ncbi:DUF4232 domain-containing protein [Streptomyces sp. NBC_00237]|uniref:DUF4232 domain-containing protein n=1 Tax=Streptomyces sp. NBC_00237 TaxID=2975687 RepID=UPI002255BB87|nr:DUF4232 domain-containing protein [Streptomyces sp. NBC_00237]MCX5206495.1 DUF4232 domain-containing protein [Streptomyces sp. NBC_00237]